MPRSKNHTRRVARSRPRGIMQLNPEGYGFVRTSEGEFFVPHAKLGGAFDGDLVEVAPLPANASKGHTREGSGGGRYGHKRAARVVSVIERAHEVVVGRFEAAEPFGVVVPLDPHIPYDIFTQLSEAPDVEDGAIVRVRIAQFPSRNSAATGHIEEVLEHVDGLDEAGRPQGVELRRKNAATSLVEEMMIWANEVVAEHLSRAKFPCVYRVHEAPDLEGLAQLVPIFEEFPWFEKIDPVGFFTGSQHALQQAVSASRGRAEGELVSSLVLRSMKRAVYREKNCGHYGLASATYCHFTSPIRRYPDLMVHRMLKAELFGRPEKFDQMTTNLGWICEHSSGMEREADDAQRESEELKLAEYLQRFVGQSFSAIVSGVSQGGLYARLENTAEGFIPVRTLGDDYFGFDAARYTLTGEETGARYRLGQRIAVVLFAVDPRVPQIDLRLAQGSRR